MSFATDLLSGLTGFRDHLVTTAEELAKPALAAVEGHLARLEPLVRTNILAAEDEAKVILHELYGSLVSEVKTEVATPLPAATPAPVETPAPAPVAEPVAPAAPVAADPTPAPSTTTEASSAPSSTPSDSTETPAAPVAETPATPAQ